MMKLFVWDFHGVLEKDNDLAVLDISNIVLEQAGFSERFSEEDNRNYYGLKWFQYFEKLLPGLTNEQHLALQAACFRYAEENMDILSKYIKPNDHITEVLQAIKRAGHDQIIISNTRPADLVWFVHAVEIEEYFPEDKIFGVNAHEKHGSKKDALINYLGDKNFEDIVIVGDTSNDMKLKDVKGGISYFYNHPHVARHNNADADYTITDLREILREI